MPSQQTIDIVKSTAPILAEHGETLTKHFYQRMFAHNPEVAPFFNSANQAGGTQQRALAAAICAYAANIDNLDVLGSAVELIANKHASLMVKPEHYPIVGDNLLASIREVLGEGATDEVIQAWAEAYRFLADILTGREKQLYAQGEAVPGGWEGFKTLKIWRKEQESSGITSFYLKCDDGGELPAYKAGQYITVRVPTQDGSTTMRNYSLSDQSGLGYFRISVKREMALSAETPNGFVSHFLHDQKQVGDTLEIAPPVGEFFLDLDSRSERPLVLLAAGVGITPILSILKTALEAMPGRGVVFVHGCLSEATQAFKGAIDALSAKYPNFTPHYRYSDEEPGAVEHKDCSSVGFVTAELIESLVPGRNADYYFCGPKPFMINIYRVLQRWGIPDSQVHFEFFGPREELEQTHEPKENGILQLRG